MKSSTSLQQKPLRFNNYDELKKKAEIDRKVLAQLKRSDLRRCYENFLSMMHQARMRGQLGDEEDSYIFYKRAMEIFRLVNDKMDDAFKRSSDGRHFHESSDNLFITIVSLADNLKKRYKAISDQNEVAGELQPIPMQDDDETSSSFKFVKPMELLRRIETNGTSVLLIDYRNDQDRYVKSKSIAGIIDVVHFDPESIMLGSLLHSLTKMLDISARPYMEKISQYDLVVLLGDLNDMAKQHGSKTCILYAALTTYNRTNKLKRPPSLLEGGFEAWEMTYPCYIATRTEIPQFEKTFEEHFASLIENSRHVYKVDAFYPNLNEDIENPRNVSVNSVSDYPVDTHFQREQRPKLPNASNGIRPAIQSNGRTSPIPRKEIIHQRIPSVDRSKKPAETINRNASQDRQEGIAKTRSALVFPQVQTIGGARVAADIQPIEAIDAPTSSVINTQLPKPPTPDRSTKRNIITQQPQQQFDLSEHFRSSYKMALRNIAEDSKYKSAETKPGCTGLVNMGNTCFMNATLQALFHTPEFSHLFRNNAIAKHINPNNSLGTKGIISGCFSALIDLAWSGHFSALRPFFFLQIFAQRVNSTLADRQQHDAQEFQIYLLDALHEDTNKVDQRRPFEQNYDSSNLAASAQDFIRQSRLFSSSPVNDIFNMITISVLQCKACSATSVCFEGLNQISVELPNYAQSTLRLRDCLNTHFSTTMLDAPWDCPRCRRKQAASRTTKIWDIPKILIVHLKRFTFESGHFVKNEVDVDFEIDNLDLTPHIHSKAPSTILNKRYNLYAVTNHSGSLNSGHYTSFIQSQGEWLYFDDENCTRKSPSSIVSKQAFLLYYALES